MATITAGQPFDLLLISKIDAEIGDYQWSELTETQFNEEKLGTWVIADGRDVSGSLYQSMLQKTTVPDATTEGTFLRQAKAGRVLGSYEEDEFKAHSHGRGTYKTTEVNGVGRNISGTSSSRQTGTTGGSETRPKNIALNMFIKVNY